MIEPVQEEKNFLKELSEETPFNIAMDLAMATLKKAESTMNDLNSIVNNVKKSARQLRYDDIAVSEITRKHIKLIIDNLEKSEGEFSGRKEGYFGWTFDECS